jgi:hypothetical protein
MENLKMLLEYLKVLVWPFIILSLFSVCRNEIKRLIDRIKVIKYPGGSVEADDSVIAQEVKFKSILEEKDKTIDDLTNNIQQLLKESKEDTGLTFKLINELKKYKEQKGEQQVVESEIQSTSMQHWQSISISNQESMAFVNEMRPFIKQETKEDPRRTYWKSYIAFGTSKKDYAWFSPRISKGMCYIIIRVGKLKIDETVIELKRANIMHYVENGDTVIILSQPNITDNEDNKAIIKRIVKYAYDSAKSNE